MEHPGFAGVTATGVKQNPGNPLLRRPGFREIPNFRRLGFHEITSFRMPGFHELRTSRGLDSMNSEPTEV